MSEVIRVLFVCVHNAARSRMAEALLRELGGPRFEVSSAGFDPREVNPLAIEAMERLGLPLTETGRQPSVFELFKEGRHFHYVIGVCDEAQGEKCPHFLGVTRRIFWTFPDPSTFTGGHDEKLARVIEVRDAIRERIEAWLKTVPHEPTKTRGQAPPRN